MVAGFEAVELRGWLRRLRAPMTAGVFALECAFDPSRAAAILRDLTAAGFVRDALMDEAPMGYALADEPRDALMWVNTVVGQALSKARVGKPIPLVRAERVLDGLIERARAYNASDDRFYDVEWIEVFGSVVRGSPTVGDIDVRVLAVRYLDDDEFERRRLELLRGEANPPRSFINQLGFPLTVLFQVLRQRLAVIDLQLDEVYPLPLPAGSIPKVVFEREPGCRSNWPAAIDP
jgi:hypothetical protein